MSKLWTGERVERLAHGCLIAAANGSAKGTCILNYFNGLVQEEKDGLGIKE